ncbi:caspase family protein [Taklimakanibacter lacteus]|uniref:caspase family protein n=1 Tax=Taklimakanibacter lacteus TaxID=2268456 RepID=UPI000E664E3F
MTYGPASYSCDQGGTATLLRLLLLLWLTVLAPSLALAEEARPLKGVALVIGQSGYRHLPTLANTGNDARAITQLLTGLGFEARSVADRDAAKLRRDLERFAEGADVAILYYSGHGIEAGGENYLLPVDADLAALDDAGNRLTPLSTMIERIRQSVPVSILLIDACRTNPFPPNALVKVQASLPGASIGANGLGAPKGAMPIEDAPQTDTLGIVIGYAAEPGRAALDGEKGGTSPYASALIRHLSAMKGSEFGAVMRMVTEEVYLKTQGRQRPWVNESLRRFLYFGAAPEEPQGEQALITGERRQLLLTIAALPDAERRQIEGIAADGGVPLDALYGVLRALGEQQVPADSEALDKLLRSQAEKLKTMMAERQALEADDPEIVRLASAADRAIAEGAIATARRFLDQAVARVDATRGAVDQAEEKLKAKRLADAAVYERRGQITFLAFDYLAAARDYQSAFELAEKWDARKAWWYKVSVASLLQQHGFNKGDLPTLRQSIEVYREAVAFALSNDETRVKFAYTQGQLGTALMELALRENNAAMFDEAAAAYRVVEENPLHSRAIDPQTWAAIQNNLGILLQEQGLREKGTAKLRQSAAAFRAALAARPRESDIHAWARAMNNLGNTLQFIGGRENDVTTLEEAVTALRASLEVRTRDSTPVDWALTQYNLGLALRALGQAKPDKDLIREAANAFHLALEETPRARFPLNWTKIHGTLYETLLLLSEDEQEEVISSYRRALDSDARLRDPQAWARVQYNLGAILLLLAGRDPTTNRLENAVQVFRAALEVHSRDRDRLIWADTQYNLGFALHKLGRRESGTVRLEESASAYREALREQTRDSTPFEWAKTMAALGQTLQALGQRKKSATDLEEAIRSYEAAIQGFGQAGATSDAKSAERGLVLARALLELVRKP